MIVIEKAMSVSPTPLENRTTMRFQNEMCRILEGGTDEMKNVVYLPLTITT